MSSRFDKRLEAHLLKNFSENHIINISPFSLTSSAKQQIYFPHFRSQFRVLFSKEPTVFFYDELLVTVCQK